MNIRRSDSPKNDFLSDIKAIIGALRLLAVLGLSIIVLFLIFWWDAGLEHPFVEVGPTEFSQTILLLLSTSLFFIEAFHRPEIRRALILVGGLTGCMLIREQDYFLDILAHGCWKWPALALAFGCLACAAVNVRDTIAALARFVHWKHFPLLLAGLVIVLAYSRLFGTGFLWKTLLPDGDWRAAKNAMEESSELLGYALIVTSALLLRFGRK